MCAVSAGSSWIHSFQLLEPCDGFSWNVRVACHLKKSVCVLVSLSRVNDGFFESWSILVGVNRAMTVRCRWKRNILSSSGVSEQ